MGHLSTSRNLFKVILLSPHNLLDPSGLTMGTNRVAHSLDSTGIIKPALISLSNSALALSLRENGITLGLQNIGMVSTFKF